MVSGKKLLILSVSAGNGHVRAAEGLVAGLERWFPGNTAKHLDLMTLVPMLFRKTYKDGYLTLVQTNPDIWGVLYGRTDKQRETVLSGIRRGIESACNKKLIPVLKEYAPDHIVCTHFMPLQVLARWKAKGRLTQPIWTCITDFVTHRFWLEPGQDGYFCSGEEDAWRLGMRGLDPARVFPTGIPVMPDFLPSGDPAIARADAANRFGLDPAKTTFLLMGGGAGFGKMSETAKALLDIADSFQLIALAGRNKAQLEELLSLAAAYPGRLLPMGFTNEVPALLACSDLVISKPGGLTTVECLATGKPMLAYAPIPGQEEHNADYLLECGAAMKALDLPGLTWRVRKLLTEPDRLARLTAAAAAAGKPYAARDILARILGE